MTRDPAAAGREEDELSVWIESRRNPDGESQCLITWDPVQFYASVADVRPTALDLLTCAACAEMMMVVSDMGLPPEHVTRLGAAALRKSGRAGLLGTPATMMLGPAGSSKTGEAAVTMRRGTQKATIPAADARQIALQFLEMAEAAESDDLVSEAMIGTGISTAQADRAFKYLLALRGAADAGAP